MCWSSGGGTGMGYRGPGVIDDNVGMIENALGSVDILVNNTGGPPPSPVSNQAPAVWLDHFQSMVLSVIAISDRIVPGMRTRGWGRVVTSTSSGVVAPIPNLGLSNSLRTSLLGWSKTLAHEVAADGVTSNVVIPGRIGTWRIEFLDRAKAEREARPSSRSAPKALRRSRSAATAIQTNMPPPSLSWRACPLRTSPGSVVRVDGGLIAST
jgi:3-oxoacyl-[acyl-carrier protein] reductase